MGCSASIDSAAAKYAVGEPPPTINVWDHYLARLPTELRDKAAMDTASARILPTLAAKEAALRDQQRALSQELSRHTWRVGLQKSSKKGFAAALGAVEAIGALLARPGEACAAADFARIAKRRERQRLVEATVAVAVSSEHVKRQSMLRRRLAALQFARDYVDKLATASVSEIRTLHDEAQHELATAEVVLDRLSPALAASAGAKHRLLRAEGVLRFAEMPEHATLFDDESRARLASEAELCGKRLRAAKHQATRVKEARGARNLARQMLAMIKAVGGAPPTKEKALAVKLMVDDQILEAEDELVILRARRGVSRHALAQRELHGAAATLRELRTRKAALAQTERSDTCVHQAMLMGQLDESVAVVALYRGARQLKRRERRLLRAALGASDTLDELLGEPLADVACYIRSAQDAAREEVAALETAIAADSDKAMEVRLARERWEVARGARAFARAVAKRQRLPPDDHVTLEFTVRKDVKKKAAFKKLKQVKRMEFVSRKIVAAVWAAFLLYTSRLSKRRADRCGWRRRSRRCGVGWWCSARRICPRWIGSAARRTLSRWCIGTTRRSGRRRCCARRSRRSGGSLCRWISRGRRVAWCASRCSTTTRCAPSPRCNRVGSLAQPRPVLFATHSWGQSIIEELAMAGEDPVPSQSLATSKRQRVTEGSVRCRWTRTISWGRRSSC